MHTKKPFAAGKGFSMPMTLLEHSGPKKNSFGGGSLSEISTRQSSFLGFESESAPLEFAAG
jgi:hypothetical protein